MKKIFYSLMLIIPFVFYGCGDDNPNNTTPGTNLTPQTPSTNAKLRVENQYAVLKTNNNSIADVYIDNVSQSRGDTVTITMSNQNNYSMNHSFIASGYRIILSNNTKETAIGTLDISVKNSLGNEILNEQVPVYTVHRIFPFYYQNNQIIPYLDNYEYTIGYGQKATILFKQIKKEVFMNVSSTKDSTNSSTSTLHFGKFGFNNTFDNVTTGNGFEVNNTTDEFTVDNVVYPNCLKTEGIDICALEVTNNNTTDTTAEFYLTIHSSYVDNKLIFKSAAQ